MFNRKLKERLEEAENLIGCLKTFIFVAKTDRKHSHAVNFVDAEIKAYDRKWRTEETKEGS